MAVKKANEKLAAYAHEAWSHWMRYLFSQCLPAEGTTDWTIPEDKVLRWQRQMNTPYKDLPEHEKKSDRDEALKIQAIFFGDEELEGD